MARRRVGRKQPSRVAEVTIDAIAPTGEGIGRLDGRAVFVPATLVGERVSLRIYDAKVLRGELLEVIAASSDRVDPPCAYAARCGGCDFMHARGEAQRQMHRIVVAEVLRGVFDGEIAGAADHGDLGYRTRARLSLAAHGTVRVGYLQPRSRRLVDIERCIVLDPHLDAVVPLLRRVLARARGDGEAEVALADDLPVVDLHWDSELGGEVFAAVDALVKERRLAGARLWVRGATAPATFGDPRPRGIGFDGRALAFPPGGFAQASHAGAAALAESVAAEVLAGEPAVELFAGSGTLSIAIAPRASRLVAVEQSPDAARALRENLESREIEARVVIDDANSWAIPRPVATAILDPPRAGAVGACERIAEARPKRVLYVSCNATTLARDAAALRGHGYTVRRVALFELFPHTSHVETLAVLERG